MPSKLRAAIIVIVTLVWGANFAAPIFVKDYEPSPELNVAFMAILGIVTAGGTMAKEKRAAQPKRGRRKYEPKHRKS